MLGGLLSSSSCNRQIQGRCLNSETILFGNREVSSGPEADWSRAITKAAALSAVGVSLNVLICRSFNMKLWFI